MVYTSHSGSPLARTLLTVLVLLVLSAPARAEDWLAALQEQVASLDSLVDAPEAAEISQVDLFGESFRLSSLRGRVVLLSFLDRQSADEAITWLERQTTWMLHQPEVSFVNVFHPGGISFMIPRGEVVHRIRKSVRNSERSFAAGLTPEEREQLEAADIHWVVDWKRRISARYPVERGRVNVFLLDRKGRIREVHRYDPASPRARLRAGVEALLASGKEGASRVEDL